MIGRMLTALTGVFRVLWIMFEFATFISSGERYSSGYFYPTRFMAETKSLSFVLPYRLPAL